MIGLALNHPDAQEILPGVARALASPEANLRHQGRVALAPRRTVDLVAARPVAKQLIHQVTRLGEQGRGEGIHVERADSGVTSTVGAAVPRSVRSRLARWTPGGGGRGAGKDGSVRIRGRGPAACAAVTALLLAFHSAVPNAVGRLGSLLETFLPWLGLVVVFLFGLALVRRSAVALVALLLPTAVWAWLFGGLLLPAGAHGAHDLVVVQHNVNDVNPDPAGTARALTDAEPDLIALQELMPPALAVYEKTLAPDYPYHAVEGTVGLWSKYPLTDARLLDIKPRGITDSWSRGLRAVVHAPRGEIAAYVAHLPSVRVGASGLASSWRDESAGLLGRAVAADRQKTVILLGDLNGTVDDRGLAPLTSRMNVAERGLAFSFPAAFPVARIDQVMARSASVAHLRTLPATGSDHLPVAARITVP